MSRLKLDEVVIVEGKYDKIKLEPLVDAIILTTDGFGIFKDREKQALIKRLARERGILVLTDSDSAGFVIRNFLAGCVEPQQLKHAYAPRLFGKESRKQKPSKEGLLGVEGVDGELLLKALGRAGVSVREQTGERESITRMMLYEDGFIGQKNSSGLRKMLLKSLELPELISTGRLIELLNAIYTVHEYKEAADAIKAQAADE